jgi:uncharacterized membrane protein
MSAVSKVKASKSKTFADNALRFVEVNGEAAAHAPRQEGGLMFKRLFLALCLSMLAAPIAQADVDMCNKTSSTLNFAIASWVSEPYDTNQVSGWFVLAPGTCSTLWGGDYTGRSVYSYAFFTNGEDYIATDEYFASICVPLDGSKFTRRGSWKLLQSCDGLGGWGKKPFFESKVTSSKFTINFNP